jgi:hypothetical protein
MTKPTNKKELSKKPIKQKKDTSSLDVSFFVFMMVSTLSIRKCTSHQPDHANGCSSRYST